MKYKIVKKESKYQGFFRLNRYHIKNELFSGGWSPVYTREVFERGHAVAVLLLDVEREKLVLVEQIRPGAMETQDSPWLIELVAGIIEEGEQPQEVVVRESLEEAQCQVQQTQKICDYLVSPGGTTETIQLFLGKIDHENLPKYAGLDVENEDIKIHYIDVSLAFEWLNAGKLNNSMSIIALQWLKLNWSARQNFFSESFKAK